METEPTNQAMKIAYLILAHNAPKHLQRLISALSTSSSSFFIHLDKKTNIDDFANIQGRNVNFISERIKVFWGDFSQVEAILILLRTAFTHQNRFERFVLISGVDYPLRSASYIQKFFEHHKDKEFINIAKMPDKSAGKPISRLTTYYLFPPIRSFSSLSQRIRFFMQKILTKIMSLHKRDYKARLGGLVPYAGSSWWALSYTACQFILNFVEQETHVVDFFKNTHCPDESFIHTILGNSMFISRASTNLTYTDWSANRASPAYITEKHLRHVYSMFPFVTDGGGGHGEKLFARKFSNESEYLIEKLKNHINASEKKKFLFTKARSTSKLT